jgi:hypothetical protein
MTKYITTVVIMACVLTGCSSSLATDSISLAPGTEYVLKDVSVALDQLIEVEGYPSEEELTVRFVNSINQALQAADVLADEPADTTVEAVISIDYQRRFTGDATPFPSESLVAPFFGYAIQLSNNGELIGTIAEPDLTLSQGFWGNLKTVATMGAGGSPKDEKQHIAAVSNTLTEALVEVANR